MSRHQQNTFSPIIVVAPGVATVIYIPSLPPLHPVPVMKVKILLFVAFVNATVAEAFFWSSKSSAKEVENDSDDQIQSELLSPWSNSTMMNPSSKSAKVVEYDSDDQVAPELPSPRSNSTTMKPSSKSAKVVEYDSDDQVEPELPSPWCDPDTPILWHPNYSVAWDDGVCTQKADCDSLGYSTKLECCSRAYSGQQSGACIRQLPNTPPTTTSVTTSKAVDGKWYADYSVAWSVGVCKNIFPCPTYITAFFESQMACCESVFAGQTSKTCINASGESSSPCQPHFGEDGRLLYHVCGLTKIPTEVPTQKPVPCDTDGHTDNPTESSCTSFCGKDITDALNKQQCCETTDDCENLGPEYGCIDLSAYKPTANPTASPTAKQSDSPTAIPTHKPSSLRPTKKPTNFHIYHCGSSATNANTICNLPCPGGRNSYCGVGQGCYITNCTASSPSASPNSLPATSTPSASPDATGSPTASPSASPNSLPTTSTPSASPDATGTPTTSPATNPVQSLSPSTIPSSSPIDRYVLDLTNFTVGAIFTSTTMFTSMSSGGITMALNSPSFYGGSAPGSRDRQIQSGPFGGIAGNSIMFEQSPAKDGGQSITFSFSKTVCELSFTITDIDNGNDNQTGIIGASDLIVIVNPTTYTYTVPIGSSVIGNGTSVGTTATSGPFRNTNDTNYDKSSPAGNIKKIGRAHV